MAEHNDLGEQGEQLATDHLVKLGYTVLERNWHFGKEEVDIIARQGQTLVIAEVKTRRSDAYGDPRQFVSRAKQQHLIRAAHAYVQKFDLDLEVRFDVVGIIIGRGSPTIDHIEGAFQPRW